MQQPNTVDPTGRLPFPLSDKDQENLTAQDKNFTLHTWENLKEIVAANKLDSLTRKPSDLRRYIDWSTATKKEYGTIINFVLRNRLGWELSDRTTAETGPIFETVSNDPFKSPEDRKMLRNDWPYGLAPGITHLIVWLKNRLQTTPGKGDMTMETRKQVQAFVSNTFEREVKDLPGHPDKILWFKNWVSIQSVPGIDHIHVLVRDVPQDMIEQWIS